MHRLAVGALAGFAALAAGCLRENVQYCGNGAYCPEPLVCTERNEAPFCGQADEVNQCRGKVDEDPCVYGSEPNGYCLSGLCTRCDPDLAFCRYEQWTAMDATASTAELTSVWATGPKDLYVVGRIGTFLHWNGRDWSAFPGVSVDADYQSIWGTSPTDIYVLTVQPFGGSRVHHFDGTQWMPQLPAPAQAPNAVAGVSATSVFVASALGEVGRYDGVWTYATVGSFTMFGVWATAANDVVAVGNSGMSLRFNGNMWMEQSTGTTHILRDVAGAPGVEVAVGRAQTTKVPAAVKREGGTWSNMTMPMPPLAAIELFGVWANSATDFYAVGDAGTILHSNGTEWTPVVSSTNALLNEIVGTSADMFAVGANGTVLRLSR